MQCVFRWYFFSANRYNSNNTSEWYFYLCNCQLCSDNPLGLWLCGATDKEGWQLRVLRRTTARGALLVVRVVLQHLCWSSPSAAVFQQQDGLQVCLHGCLNRSWRQNESKFVLQTLCVGTNNPSQLETIQLSSCYDNSWTRNAAVVFYSKAQ